MSGRRGAAGLPAAALAIASGLLLAGSTPPSRAPERTASPDCSVTLGGVRVEVNGLNNQRLICPYRDEGDDRRTICDASLPPGPPLEPGAGEMSDVTRLPQGQLEAMFLEPETYRLCQDIFQGGEFQAAMARIPRAPAAEMAARFSYYGSKQYDATQRSMGTVFLSIRSWNYCHRENRYGPFIYNALFDPQARTIVFYATACNAPSLYYDHVEYLDAGHRFYLVAGHELGHVIDDQAGHWKSHPQFTSENMATIYGTFLTECFSRSFQKILADFPQTAGTPETPMMRQARECQIASWRRLEQSLTSLRKHERTAESVSLGKAMACVSFAAPPAAPAPAPRRPPAQPLPH